MDHTFAVPKHDDLELVHRRYCFGMNESLLSRHYPLHALALGLWHKVGNRCLISSNDPVLEQITQFLQHHQIYSGHLNPSGLLFICQQPGHLSSTDLVYMQSIMDYAVWLRSSLWIPEACQIITSNLHSAAGT